MADDAGYVSPSKKQLEDALAKMGRFASPRLRETVENAIANLDHTDPAKVRELLPPDVHAFYQHTTVRAATLTPLIKQAHDAGCFIEAIILSHGMIQFALRGLYVMAWQRAVMPRPLTPDELAPYYQQGDSRGDVHALIDTLEQNGLIEREPHGNHLRSVNRRRNQAAHGVIFGEIAHADLLEHSRKCQWAAVGALKTFQAWFNNARPLKNLTASARRRPRRSRRKRRSKP
jgi:hypothetical protein